jgi:hypothetical protein
MVEKLKELCRLERQIGQLSFHGGNGNLLAETIRKASQLESRLIRFLSEKEKK